MDLDIDSDDDGDQHFVRNPVLFDLPGVNEEQEAFTDVRRATEAMQDRDSEETWARLG